MASMAKYMKQKAIPATSAVRSSEIVKRISRADIVALNHSIKPIIEQNKRERKACEEAKNIWWGD